MVQLNHAQRELTVKIVYYGPGLSGKTTNLQMIHQRTTPDVRGRLLTVETHDDRTLFFDLLPLGFYYAQGSAFIETNGNKLLITPTVNGRSLTFTVGNLNPKQTVYINYRCRVGADAHIGANINTALALSPEGIRSNESRARVDILPGITSLKQFIVGKVYLDNNQNGRFDEGDQPVVKAQLITSNGRSSLTDNTGAYSIPVIGAGTQMVGLVRDSVPDGYLPKYHNAQDGEWSLLLRTPLAGGTVLTGDFPLVKFQHQKPDCGTCQPPWVTPTPTSTPNQALINDSGVEPKTDEEVKAEREARNFVPKAATELNSEAMKREGVEQMNGEVARFTLPEKSVLYSQVAQFGVETFGNNKVKLLVNGEEVQAQVGKMKTLVGDHPGTAYVEALLERNAPMYVST